MVKRNIKSHVLNEAELITFIALKDPKLKKKTNQHYSVQSTEKIGINHKDIT